MIVQPRRSPIALGHRRPLERILLRVRGVGALIGKRQPQTLDQINQEYPPEKIFPIHRYLPSHATAVAAWCDSQKYRATAVTIRFASAKGIIHRQPTSINWS